MMCRWLLLPVIAFFAVSPALAQEAIPGNPCQTANITGYSGGPEASGKGYWMTCQGGVWVRIMESDTAGNLGVRQAAPKAPLHIGGEVIIGKTTGLSCDAGRKGGLRYSESNKCLELCDGAGWACISVGACGNAMPDAFHFSGLANQAVSTQVASEIQQITGLGCTVNVAVNGAGTPQYRICGTSDCAAVIADWTAATGTIDNNQYLQLRLTTGAAGGDTRSATVYVGSFANVWTVQTAGDCSGSPAPGTICPDGSVFAGQSPDGNVKMYVTRCDAGQSWNGAACTGTRLLMPWNDGFRNYVSVSTSNNSGKGNTVALAATDSNNVEAGAQPHIAAQYCANLNSAGHTDWYLPAINELMVLYAQKVAVGGFNISGGSYWSSSEGATTPYALRRSFIDGTGDPYTVNNKQEGYYVRCARQ